MIPKLPRAMTQGVNIEFMGVDEYVERLVKYLKKTYDQVHQIQKELAEHQGEDPKGRISAELEVGDLVKLKQPPTRPRTGPYRFEPRCRDRLFRIKTKIGPETFKIADARETTKVYPFLENGANLVKIDMPELYFQPGQRRVLEIYDNTKGEWIRHRIEKFAVDGTALLMPRERKQNRTTHQWEWIDNQPPQWQDLSLKQYRWVM